MSSFHEVLFPAAIALGATGGPELPTDVVRLSSGMESRNARWAHSRRRWDVGGAVMRMDQAQELTAFFEARGGRTYGFRFRDPLDLKSCVSSQAISALDQPLGIGDGERVDFQLVKGGGVWSERIVSKPVAGSVVVDHADCRAVEPVLVLGEFEHVFPAVKLAAVLLGTPRRLQQTARRECCHIEVLDPENPSRLLDTEEGRPMPQR